MPETTPIYAFPYPCPSDPVTAVDFADLADAIDAQMLVIQADESYALNRYNVQQVGAAQAGIAVGVDTPIASAGSTYVAPVDGFYLANITVDAVSTLTMTSCRLRPRVAAVAAPGATDYVGTVFGLNSANFILSAIPLVMTAGQTFDTTFIFFGTGTATVSLFDFDVRLVARIA